MSHQLICYQRLQKLMSNFKSKVMALRSRLKILFGCTALISALMLSPSVSANTVFYTGEPTPAAGYVGLFNNTSQQHLAFGFNLTGPSVVNTISANIHGPGDVLFELYQGSISGSSLPGVLLASGVVSIGSGASNWYSLNGLNLSLASGSYTMVFLAQPGMSSSTGYMTVGAPMSPNNFTTQWYSNNGTNWNPDSGNTIGFMLSNGAPEIDGRLLPQALLLLVGGLVVGRRRQVRMSPV